MAIVKTNFSSSDSLASAFSTMNGGFSISAAVNWGVKSFNDAYFDSSTTIASLTETGPSKISGWMTNGDSFSVWGSNVNNFPQVATHFDYTYAGQKINVSLFGRVYDESVASAPSGYVDKVVVSSSAYGSITILGYDDVAVQGPSSISSVSMDIGGVHTYVTGAISATTTLVNGYYQSLLSGTISDATLTSNGHSINLSNVDIPANMTFSSADAYLAYALSGNDSISGSAGNDFLGGYAGTDTAIFSDLRANSTITKTASGWTVSSSTDGTDTLSNIERLQFADTSIAFDIDGTAGQVYRIYQAAFNRVPDLGGLGFWIAGMDNDGVSLSGVSAGFINSAEFTSVYGANPTNSEIVTRFYENVLHRAPEQGGYDYWMYQVDHGMQATQLLTFFSESAENQAQVIGVIQNGIEYTQYAA